MRFRIGDTVRVKKGHRARKDMPNDYEIRHINDGDDNNPKQARIKLVDDNKWVFREESLRLVRRAS